MLNSLSLTVPLLICTLLAVIFGIARNPLLPISQSPRNMTDSVSVTRLASATPDAPQHEQPTIGIIGMGEMGQMYVKYLVQAGWKK